MLRLNDFNTFYDICILELDTYIRDTNAENQQGWQDAVQQFRIQLTQHIQGTGSLLDLKRELMAFCDTLRSPFNKVLNTVVGPFWTKSIGDALGAPGSRLQKALLTIAASIAPFAAVYILDEIATAKNKPPILTCASSSYVSFNFHTDDHEYLSAEGLRVLEIIVNDEALTDAFLRQAKHYRDETDARKLLRAFVNEYKPGRCGI